MLIMLIIGVILLYIQYIEYIEYIEYINRNRIETFETTHVNSSVKIEMVIARYNETLDWLQEKPFHFFPYIVYNKGVNSNYYKNEEKWKEEIGLNNVGRESHSYLYHIVSNYDDLADLTIFLPGSVDSSNKYTRSKSMIENILQKYGEPVKSVASCQNLGNDNNVFQMYKNFTLVDYLSTNKDNQKLNTASVLEPSRIKPFGTWYLTHFGDRTSNCFAMNGIFAVSKEDIRKHPKSYYLSFLQQLDSHPNPETGHYMERAWDAIFGPFENILI